MVIRMLLTAMTLIRISILQLTVIISFTVERTNPKERKSFLMRIHCRIDLGRDYFGKLERRRESAKKANFEMPRMPSSKSFSTRVGLGIEQSNNLSDQNQL